MKNKMKLPINPWFITGFSDAESSFIIKISKNEKSLLGWTVQLSFEIELHEKDFELLESIRNYFGGIGSLTKNTNKKSCRFTVSSLDQIFSHIIPHFDQFPLITQKQADYLLWKEVALIINTKKHLTEKGLKQIINIRATLNNGLTPKLEAAFPDFIPVVRPLVQNQKVEHPSWFSGFISGESNFFVAILPGRNKEQQYPQLVFKITQHLRDKELLNYFLSYFNCGKLYKDRNAYDFKVTKFSDISDIIVPFLIENKILGVKYLDFLDWLQVIELIKSQKHLTREGMAEILLLKQGINSRRKK